MSIEFDRNKSVFEDARWIASEDVKIEHLLNVPTSIHASLGDVWNSCYNFMRHRCWHNPRYTVLGMKVEGLPDNHLSKPSCLFELSQLLASVGNGNGSPLALKLEGELGKDDRVVLTLMELSDANRVLDLYEEGIQQMKEGLEKSASGSVIQCYRQNVWRPSPTRCVSSTSYAV